MSFTQKSLNHFILFVALIVTGSCLNRQFIEGRAELVLISDSTLNDSSIFVGRVKQVDWTGDYPYIAIPFEIWIENTKYRTKTDSLGNYQIKTNPGTFSIMCQQQANSWRQLIEEKRNIRIEKNKKIHIDFYIGYTVE